MSHQRFNSRPNPSITKNTCHVNYENSGGKKNIMPTVIAMVNLMFIKLIASKSLNKS